MGINPYLHVRFAKVSVCISPLTSCQPREVACLEGTDPRPDPVNLPAVRRPLALFAEAQVAEVVSTRKAFAALRRDGTAPLHFGALGLWVGVSFSRTVG